MMPAVRVLPLWMLHLSWGLAFIGCDSPLRAESPPPPSDSAESQNDLDGLPQQSGKPVDSHELDEAVRLGEEAAARARELHGENHPRVVEALEQLRDLHELREDFAAALKLADEVLQLHRQLHGAEHWKVTNASLSRQHISVLMH